MKILQFGNMDTMGNRFNGQDLHQAFLEKGYWSHHLVWDKQGNDHNTSTITQAKIFKKLNHQFFLLEKKLSIQSLLYPSFLLVPFNRYFRAADIVHFHLLHTGFFSLFGLPILSRLKRSVWTLHDPWALTGHCIHPFDCDKWKTGCGQCPNLNIDFAMKNDNTAFMWKMKKWLYSLSKIDIIVASKWMLERVQASPLFSNCKTHLIPFGVNLNLFKPGTNEKMRKELGISKESIVVCIRSRHDHFKGLKYMLEALEYLDTKIPVTILTFNEKGNLDKFMKKFHVIDLGWVEDEQEMIEAYQATDIFVMPSVAESFGMMAMEAMACGKPVIVFQDTALAETVHAPEGGIAVPLKDSKALAKTLCHLIENDNERTRIGENARRIATKHYDMNLHVERVLEVYKEVILSHSKLRTSNSNSVSVSNH